MYKPISPHYRWLLVVKIGPKNTNHWAIGGGSLYEILSLGILTKIRKTCLVGGFNHLEKYEFVNGKGYPVIPYMKRKIIQMFQTTNQMFIVLLFVLIAPANYPQSMSWIRADPKLFMGPCLRPWHRAVSASCSRTRTEPMMVELPRSQPAIASSVLALGSSNKKQVQPNRYADMLGDCECQTWQWKILDLVRWCSLMFHDCPIKPSVDRGFPAAMFDYWRVYGKLW